MKKPLPIVTRIEEYEPADPQLDTVAHLVGQAVCEPCDGVGYYLGDAHLTGAYQVMCDDCEGTGEINVELEGPDAEAAYAMADEKAKFNVT